MSSTSFLARSYLAPRWIAQANRWPLRAAGIVLGSSLLWASAKVQVPFWPVPMTMQTYVVLVLGALFGSRLGATTIATYLAEGAMGLPVFAGTPASGIGLAYMAGPTGGYLLGYLVAAVLVGKLTENAGNRTVVSTAAALLIGELAILGLGCSWLAVQFGWRSAMAAGFGPFLFGDGLKLALAVATVTYARLRVE